MCKWRYFLLPPQSEYIAECDKRREFISGFTGSAGTGGPLHAGLSPPHIPTLPPSHPPHSHSPTLTPPTFSLSHPHTPHILTFPPSHPPHSHIPTLTPPTFSHSHPHTPPQSHSPTFTSSHIPTLPPSHLPTFPPSHPHIFQHSHPPTLTSSNPPTPPCAGVAVVTVDKALLWTDGRYHLQASQQLDTNWTLMKQGSQ